MGYLRRLDTVLSAVNDEQVVVDLVEFLSAFDLNYKYPIVIQCCKQVVAVIYQNLSLG